MPESAEMEQRTQDSQEIVARIYREYAPDIEESLWPWETSRWFELVFCILTTISEPKVTAAMVRELTDTLSRLGLLDVPNLAGLLAAENRSHPLGVTLDTLLQQVGFSPDQAASAVRAISESALVLQRKYKGKIQYLLRKHGDEMLSRIGQDLGLSDFKGCSQALSLWLQNILNMPIPASNAFTDRACESMGLTYEALVEAAYSQDINVALLDDALRNYWEAETVKGESNNGTR